ncbi:hypothetical protein [Streptomyces sp. NPDC052302]|uniref:hypothetical protein n=1 Tax=Streptomyces sp. NPDC052302 TaxID=3365688 RepID=UPI0037D46988
MVNVSTMVADFGMAGMGLSGPSKAAVNLLTKSWAAEYGPAGRPGQCRQGRSERTEGTAGMGEDLRALATQAPAGPPASPEDIASARAAAARLGTPAEPLPSRARSWARTACPGHG